MKKLRIIPRLDIKGPNVIKGIHLEGLRVVGRPNELARCYYDQGADEMLYIDSVATLYGRENLLNVVRQTMAGGVFIPLTAGGGIRTIEDMREILKAGADKVAINTAAVRNPALITEAAERFGSQCVVVSIEAQRNQRGSWDVYVENGRQETGLDAIEWAIEAVTRGAGELLVTSIDKEGTKEGFDEELVRAVASKVSVPVIAAGGAGKVADVTSCFKNGCVEAVAVASLLHYRVANIDDVKAALGTEGFPVRREGFGASGRGASAASGRAKVSIINYGLGNLQSVSEAFRYLGHDVEFITTPDEVRRAKLLVLPGVGAFGEGIANLKRAGLDVALRAYAASGKPLLGICLGAQLFLTESEEFGVHHGLDLIPGRVIKFPEPKTVNGRLGEVAYRVPHVGWNDLAPPREDAWNGTVLENVPAGANYYFVHSFLIAPDNEQDVLATATYGATRFCAVVRKGNVVGTQFHPEKSGELGLELLRKFCAFYGESGTEADIAGTTVSEEEL